MFEQMNELTVHLNRSSPEPLYHQLASQLTNAIASGRLPRGEFLTNEIELAERWGVSRPTVRRAIQQLADAGLLVRRRGVGTQIISDQVRRPMALTSLHDDLVASGSDPVTDVLRVETIPATAPIAKVLRIGQREPVLHLIRRRSIGSRPLALLRNWLIADVCRGVDAESLSATGLYALLRAAGVRPHSADQRVGAKAADLDEADALHIAEGAPLVTMRRVMFDDTGRIIELGDHVYDATNYAVEHTVMEGE